jgi:hypothetical protein
MEKSNVAQTQLVGKGFSRQSEIAFFLVGLVREWDDYFVLQKSCTILRKHESFAKEQRCRCYCLCRRVGSVQLAKLFPIIYFTVTGGIARRRCTRTCRGGIPWTVAWTSDVIANVLPLVHGRALRFDKTTVGA